MKEDFGLSEGNYVTPNEKLSRHNAMLYISEDNEAVIEMTIKRQKSADEAHIPNPQRCA